MPYRLPVLALLLATTLAACASSLDGGDAAQSASTGETLVRVKNHNWADMTVYLVRGGMRVRLGTVTSMTETTLTVPRAILAAGIDVQLIADPIGSSQRFMTETIMVSPGQTIDLMLENNLNLSSYSVW